MELPRITANGFEYMSLQEREFISILNDPRNNVSYAQAIYRRQSKIYKQATN